LSAPDEGLLVPPGDAAALAAAIRSVLDEPEASAARAARFRAKVLDRFDRADRTRCLLELCERLVAEGRRG